MTATRFRRVQPGRTHLKDGVHSLVMIIAIASLASACADSATSPPQPSGRMFGIKPELSSVVLHRTTEMEGRPGAPPVVKRRTLVQQIRTLPQTREADAGVKIVSLGDLTSADEDDQPFPVISSPARSQSSACDNERPWSRTAPVPSMPGAVAVATGTGDAPATRIQLVQNGTIVGTVSRTWVRMSRSWELAHQEMTVPSRHYRDVVEVERRPAAGAALELPLPVFVCLARDSAATAREEAALDPFGSYRSISIPSALEAPLAPRQLAECTGDQLADHCQDKRDLKFAADVAYVGASLVVAVVCPTLALVKTDTCIKAVGYLGTTIAAVLAAYHALERCMEEQRVKQEACKCAGGVAMEYRGDDGRMTASMHRWLAPSSSGSSLDCDDPEGSGGDSPVSTWHDSFDVRTPADPGAGGVYVCVYESDYDATTNKLTVYPLYCYVEWLE